MMSEAIRKAEVIDKIQQMLTANHRVALESVRSAIDAATNEQTVPEHKYDTLALEASYLAHGQAKRLQECEQDIQAFKSMSEVRNPTKVVVGCLIRLLDESGIGRWVFFAPSAGGMKIHCGDDEVTLVTIQSPLGAVLKGQNVGDEVIYDVEGRQYCYEIGQID